MYISAIEQIVIWYLKSDISFKLKSFIWWLIVVLSLCSLYRKMPSLLEYLSYNCNFMGILAGPTCSYNDYIAFIEGRFYESKHLESNGKENGKFKQSDPSPKVVWLRCPLAPSGDHVT